MKATNKTAMIKSLLSTTGSQIASVTYIKADNTERVLSFNPKTAKGLKGEAASDSAKKAVETRKKNNPDLINVCDQSLLSKGKPAVACWRSFNCNKVTQVKLGGEVINFEV